VILGLEVILKMLVTRSPVQLKVCFCALSTCLYVYLSVFLSFVFCNVLGSGSVPHTSSNSDNIDPAHFWDTGRLQ
jgi:hypothetical protein